MKRARKAVGIILIAMLIFAAVPAFIGQAAQPVTLRFLVNSVSDFQASMDEFTRVKGIKVELMVVDQNKLTAMMMAGDVPDVWMSWPLAVPMAVAKGWLLPLDKYLAKGEPVPTSDLMPQNRWYRFDPKSKQFGKGPYWGLMKDFGAESMLVYNKDLFDQLGVSYPSPTKPMTMDEVRALAKKFTKYENGRVTQYGAYLNVTNIRDMLIGWLEEQGKTAFTSDQKKCNFGTPQFAKIIKYLVEMAQKDHSFPSPVDPSSEWPGNTFAQGKLAMFTVGPWYIPWAKQQDAKLRIGLAPTPDFLGAKTHVGHFAAGAGYMVFAKSKHPQESMQLFNWLMSQYAQDQAKKGWNIPGLKSMLALWPTATDDQKQIKQAIDFELNYMTLAACPPVESDWQLAFWGKQMDDVFTGKITNIDQFCKEGAARVNAILKEEL